MTTTIVQALFLYHFMEYQTGNATCLKVNVNDHTFQISDNGRGHAVDKMINGISYMKLVYTQFEYPFGLETNTPIQLHTIGISLVNALCAQLVVTAFKKENAHIKIFENGRLVKEDTIANIEGETGTTIQGTLNTDLVPQAIDNLKIEAWLRDIKSINPDLDLCLNDIAL